MVLKPDFVLSQAVGVSLREHHSCVHPTAVELESEIEEPVQMCSFWVQAPGFSHYVVQEAWGRLLRRLVCEGYTLITSSLAKAPCPRNTYTHKLGVRMPT